MSNFTDSEIEAFILIYEESKKWGKDLRNKVKAGEIDPSKYAVPPARRVPCTWGLHVSSGQMAR